MASATKIIGDTRRQRGRVKSGGAGTIGISDIVIADGNNAGYVTLMGAGSSEGDSDEEFLGVALSVSSDTSGADGFVDFASPHGSDHLELEMAADTASNLARSLVGTKVISATGTKGSQDLDENNTTKGIFRILDPHDNKFDTTNGRMRVSVVCEPWGSSALTQ